MKDRAEAKAAWYLKKTCDGQLYLKASSQWKMLPPEREPHRVRDVLKT